MDVICHLSGGVASHVAAERAITKYGRENVRLVFADTLGEDNDLYRFLIEGVGVLLGRLDGGLHELATDARTIPTPEDDQPGLRKAQLQDIRAAALEQLGPQFIWLADGRTIWEVFHDERYLGNTRVDPCSKLLKRGIIDRWVQANGTCDSLHVYGFDWSEGHRLARMNRYDSGVTHRWAPLLERPYLDKAALIAHVRGQHIEPPALYADGFSHNNCGGGCVKAGQAAFALLLRTRPARYAWWEHQEEELRSYLDKPVAILRDRRSGKVAPLPLRAFRERLQSTGEYDRTDWGSCGCFQLEETETVEV